MFVESSENFISRAALEAAEQFVSQPDLARLENLQEATRPRPIVKQKWEGLLAQLLKILPGNSASK
jgi:hypothetical protein